MTSKQPVDLSHLERWAGKRPPKSGFKPSVSPTGVFLIGLIAVQWGALSSNIEYQIRFKRRFPIVPAKVRGKRVRYESQYQIEYLRQLGQIIYAEKRQGAAKEFASIMDKIAQLKGPRDQLAHGTFALKDNEDPNSVTVIYKKKKHKFSLQRLQKIATEIGVANGTLMEFDSWVDYDTFVSLHEKLLQQDHQ